jgi:Ala-tRNA(Pro) deacylase
MNRHVSFERLHHRPQYTANRVAQALHVPGREMAKTVILRTSDGYMMAVLPATHRVNLERMREELGERDLDFASEAEMDRLFPDCERGAMPPFGSLYNLPTMVDETLAEDDDIVFEAQNHEEAFRMKFRDYEEVEQPRHGRFAEQLG